MTNSVKIFLPDGKITNLTVGTDGVQKIFVAKETPNTVIVLTDEGIVEYGNVTWVALRDYAEKKK